MRCVEFSGTKHDLGLAWGFGSCLLALVSGRQRLRHPVSRGAAAVRAHLEQELEPERTLLGRTQLVRPILCQTLSGLTLSQATTFVGRLAVQTGAQLSSHLGDGEQVLRGGGRQGGSVSGRKRERSPSGPKRRPPAPRPATLKRDGRRDAPPRTCTPQLPQAPASSQRRRSAAPHGAQPSFWCLLVPTRQVRPPPCLGARGERRHAAGASKRNRKAAGDKIRQHFLVVTPHRRADVYRRHVPRCCKAR